MDDDKGKDHITGMDIEQNIHSAPISPAKKEKERWKASDTLSLLGFVMFIARYGMRSNLSVAAVAMKDELGWDEPTQGLVISSFFYGYMCTSIVGGRVSEYLGSKIVLSSSLLVTSILALLTPVAIRYSTTLFVVMRIIQGLSEGVTSPSMNYFISKWVLKEESAKVTSRIFTGGLFGSFVSMPVCGWLSSSFLGWTSCFYIYGFLGVVIFCLWEWFATDDPRDCKFISKKELEHINQNSQVEHTKEVCPVPWVAIFTSASFWYVAGVSYSTAVGYYTLLTELPSYLVEILGFSLSNAGMLAGFTFLASWIFGIIYSTIVTILTTRKLLPLHYVRRISQFITGYGTAFGFLALIFSDNSPGLAVVLFLVIGAVHSASYSGYTPSNSDLSPRFAGTIYGLTNMVGTTSGFVVPLITGQLTKHNQSAESWHWLFVITILMSTVPATPYILFYTAEVQPWNEPKDVGSKAKAGAKDVSNEPRDVCNGSKDICSDHKGVYNEAYDDCNEPKDVCNESKGTCNKSKNSYNESKDDVCNVSKIICNYQKSVCNESYDDCSEPKDICNEPKDNCNESKDVCNESKSFSYITHF